MKTDENSQFGLDGNVIASIRTVFTRYAGIEEAVVYGSRAKGNFRPGSDIDIALMGNLNLETLNSISFEIDDLMLPYTFDLTIYSRIHNSELTDHINRAGKTLYTRQQL